MNIYDVIEICHLERSNLTPDVRKEVINSFDIKQWLKLIHVFLAGLDKQHSVPGKDIQRLYDYLNYYKERNTWTWEQHWHVVAIIIDNWDQMSCESRASMLL